MAREKFSTTIDAELLRRMRDMSVNTEIPISKLFDRAVRLLLENEQKKDKEKED